MELEFELAFGTWLRGQVGVGKESGLKICMEPGRCRSSTQFLGQSTRGKRVPCVARSGRDAGVQSPAWDTCAAGETLLDCRATTTERHSEVLGHDG